MVQLARFRLVLSVALLSATGLAATAARAEEASVAVSLSGLDLATPDGQAEAQRRLVQAANRLCVADQGGALSDRSAFEACRDSSLASADSLLQRRIALATAAGGYAVAQAGR